MATLAFGDGEAFGSPGRSVMVKFAGTDDHATIGRIIAVPRNPRSEEIYSCGETAPLDF
jgi:hypothetical protein